MSKRKTQKIIIPKGTVNPHEDTLIEIPTNFKGTPIFVAKKHDGPQGKSILIETDLKNVDFEGDKYKIKDRRSKVQITRQDDDLERSFDFLPLNHSSQCDLVNNDQISSPTRNNSTNFRCNNETIKKSNLEATSSTLRCQSSCTGTSKDIEKIKKSSLNASASCDKSLQIKSKTQKSNICIKAAPTTDILYSSCPQQSSGSIGPASSNVQYKEAKARNFEDVVHRNADRSSTNMTYVVSKVETPRTKPEVSESNCETCCKHSKNALIKNDSFMDEPLSMLKNSDDLDDVYIQQLKRQFDEAKRKLEEAILLASMSFKQLGNRLSTQMSQRSGHQNRGASICDSVPERDVAFSPSCGNKPSYVVYVSGPKQNPCSNNSMCTEQSPQLRPDSSFYSDPIKSTEVYRNITTKKPTEERPRYSSMQKDTDTPVPFLKSSLQPSPRKEVATQNQAKKGGHKSKRDARDVSVQTEKTAGTKCSGSCYGNSTKQSVGRPLFGNQPESESFLKKTSNFSS